MLDFHDPFVQFVINAGIAIIAIVSTTFISIWIYRKQRSKKEISYAIISIAPVITVKTFIADKIKIYLDGNEIKEAQLAVLVIKNTGNVAVKREDYDEPIVVDFPSRKILNGYILTTKPKDLFKPEDAKTFLAWNGSSMALGKQLLNPKEEIQFSVLLEGSNVAPSIRGRIIDGSLIKYLPDKRNITRLIAYLVAIIGTYVIYFSILAAIGSHPAPQIFFTITIVMLVIVLLIAFGATRLVKNEAQRQKELL